MESLGSRLNKLRIKSNKKVKDLAQSIGISIQAWTDYEKDRTMPQLDKLMAIAEYFDVSLDYLAYGKENEIKLIETNEHYNSYLNCLIELLSANLLKVKPIESILDPITFESTDEHMKLFCIEYLRAVKNNEDFLNKEEMKELLNIISKRFENILIELKH